MLGAGGLVAFPTETVYGLGADATRDDGVERIFRVKRRPLRHPLIAHFASLAMMRDWVELPPMAVELGERFWPGPLTCVVRRSARLSPLVSGGLDTLAVRVPGHPLARALIAAFGSPLAAPSANRFGRVSPTSAEHVRTDLGSDVDFVLDGGACEVGVESTIVDCLSEPGRLLRRGSVTLDELCAATTRAIEDASDTASGAPGTLPAHYAPEARLVLVERDQFAEAVARIAAQGARVGALLPPGRPRPAQAVHVIELESDPILLARNLYRSLRELDAHCDVIVASLPPEVGVGAAVADRLRRAAAASH